MLTSPSAVSPEDIKELRKGLTCTARELAEALGLDQKTVLAWEAGELFPTKRFVDQMEALRAGGPAAIPKKPRGKQKKTGVALLAEPELWTIVRKLLAHPTFYAKVAKLAAEVDDPADKDA